MKASLLEYLACPACGSDLELFVTRSSEDEIQEGALRCGACPAEFSIRSGIPRFVEPLGRTEARTAEAFAYEWERYDELAERYRRQFLDWINPVEPEFFRGKVVLEGGCGKGRHTALAAEFGARAVVALDIGKAVEVAYRNTRHLPNAHVVQADLNRPPLKRVFDYAFSVGVLHHLGEPEVGFRALVSRVRPGGSVSAWVYGREGNGWIVHLVTPLRQNVTSRLPHFALDWISALLTLPLFVVTRLLYGRIGGTILGVPLPYRRYLSYIADFPFREQRSIVLDQLMAPVAHYIRREEFASWFQRAGLGDVRIERHNDNSWRGLAATNARG